jgi:secondary thiamine-phosphate synthase enzyme
VSEEKEPEMETLSIRTSSRTDLRDITREVAAAVERTGAGQGVCVVYVPHTTAGVTINENADPAVRADIDSTLDRMVPWNGPYRHMEGNAAAHVKASMVGFSALVPVDSGRLVLGTWQGIYFCEFDGPRTRKVHVLVAPAL